VKFHGWARTSLIDFPGQIATVLFTAGCNFRCPMCHNADLVLHPHTLPEIQEAELWTFLEKRAGLVTGVVVTGGEPTLQSDLPAFLRRVRALGYAVKLDTNGYRPQVLEGLLAEGLVDYVAMDVKGPPEGYAALAGLAEIDLGRVARSRDLLMGGATAYEFRTTVVPGLLAEPEVEAIARWIEGAARYVLQQFRGQEALDPALEGLAPYPLVRLEAMAARARPFVHEVRVR
jgi:pyruvate formate lyase activating enzyme